MDMSRVHHVKSQSLKRDKSKTMSFHNKKPVKVVYVSTPLKLNICASNFRALVQELTGRESDLSRFHDFNIFNSNYSDNGNNDDVTRPVVSVNDGNVSRPVIHEFQSVEAMVEDSLYEYSPSTSESLLDSFDDVVSSQIVEELEQMFPSNLFGYDDSCISHQNHVLGDVYGVL